MMATGIPRRASPKKNHQKSNNWNGIDFTIDYPGKTLVAEVLNKSKASLNNIFTVSMSKCPEWFNKLIFGDNLPILITLLNDKQISGNVRMVYIDPPFSTRMIFQSRSQKKAYDDALTGAHYLEFLRQRLIVLREILSRDGSIYVHLDSNMAFPIKVILDEIFGPKNFRNWIVRKKCNTKNYTRKQYGNVADYVLFYTKSSKYVWNRSYKKWPAEKIKKEYQYIDEKTGRLYKKVPLHAPGIRKGDTGKTWRGMLPPPGKHWQFPPDALEEMDKKGEIYWSPNGNPRRKIFFDNSKGIPVQDIWLDLLDAHNQNAHITGYPTEKNSELLDRIVKASSNPNDLVLDCFSGSGTTLSVCEQLSRKWIGIDNSKEAISITLQRLLSGPRPMGDYVTSKMQQKQLFNKPKLTSSFALLTSNDTKIDAQTRKHWILTGVKIAEINNAAIKSATE